MPTEKPTCKDCSSTGKKINNDNEWAKELLDEEFQCYKRVAKSLMKTLKKERDAKICDILIKRCSKLNKSEMFAVKKEVNDFYKYFLKILCWTSDNQHFEDYNPRRRYPQKSKDEAEAWLHEKRANMDIQKSQQLLGSQLISQLF